MKRTYHTAIIYKPYFKEISDMGKKKWIAPFAALILECMIGTLLIYPIINMQPKNIVIGLLSLDKGAELPQGKVDLGDKLTKNITSATEKSDDPSAVRWKIYKFEKALSGNKIISKLDLVYPIKNGIQDAKDKASKWINAVLL